MIDGLDTNLTAAEGCLIYTRGCPVSGSKSLIEEGCGEASVSGAGGSSHEFDRAMT